MSTFFGGGGTIFWMKEILWWQYMDMEYIFGGKCREEIMMIMMMMTTKGRGLSLRNGPVCFLFSIFVMVVMEWPKKFSGVCRGVFFSPN